jgi:hypothetical protein
VYTSGERLVRCLAGDAVDRPPFGVGIGWQPWGQTLERWRRETGKPDLDPARELGFEEDFILPEVRLGLFPAFDPQLVREEGEHVIYRDTRGILTRGRKDGMSMPEFLDYPVKSRADWERIRAERLQPDEPERLSVDWQAFRWRIGDTGAAVQVGSYPYGVFGTPRDLMGVEALLLSFYDDPGLLRDMMGHLTSVWIAVYQAVAREVHIDHIHIWEDMSGRQGSLVSPAMVEELMMPCYDRIAAFAREAGVRLFSVDTDGWCAELLPVMMRHGLNAMLPFEVQAGNDVREYRKLYPDLGIIGGLDKRALAAGREAIDREVERAAWMVEKGRYVPGFDHLIPPDVPWESFAYAAERLREVCRASARTT